MNDTYIQMYNYNNVVYNNIDNLRLVGVGGAERAAPAHAALAGTPPALRLQPRPAVVRPAPHLRVRRLRLPLLQVRAHTRTHTHTCTHTLTCMHTPTHIPAHTLTYMHTATMNLKYCLFS